MKKTIVLIISAIFIFLLMAVLIGFYWYKNSLGPVSSNSETIQIEVASGSTYITLADTLYDNKLIKSKTSYKIYIKLNPPKNGLKAGTYYLSQNMGVEKIITSLSSGGASVDPNQISITFKEGINMRRIASLIAEKTNNSEEDVYKLLNDKEYLKSLVEEYWFIDNSILNEKLYYPLEGYLFPDTYYFANKDVSIKEIFKTLLDQMGKKLEPLRPQIEKSKYSVHELLTLASIVELEVATIEHRGKVAGVFYNRLNAGMNLGSDPTTYYGAGVDMSERELTREEFNAVNDYNTRANALHGKLPVGPICMPSMSSIEASISPTSIAAYYFVADKNGETYFTKTYNEHLAKIQQLKESGLWYTR